MSKPNGTANKVSLAPNQTLYVRNLPEKLNKSDLKIQLYLLFTTYGSVLDIVALKTMKMRGQAHITFKDISTASHAMRNLDGFEFFGRKLVISYAKSKSDYVAKLDGTFVLPEVNGERQTEAAAAGDKGTALQQAVFGGVPASGGANKGQGVKRTREEEEEEQKKEDVPMDEDDEEEEEAEMEMDESDDD